MSDGLRELLAHAAKVAADYRADAAERPVFPSGLDPASVRAALGALPDAPQPARKVVDQLAAAVDPALNTTTGPRYFGFVIGGALDAATAAEVLAAGWDQPAYNAMSSPAASLVEEVAGEWLKDVLGIPASASFGFVTGAQGANTVCLAAARHHVLAKVGWDVERDGLVGAPTVRIVANQERHATIDRSLRLLGFGAACIEPVATTAQGAIDVADLQRVLIGERHLSEPNDPTIVCLQAGNVNTGACDDLAAACAVAHAHGAWAHVDGAFGLWAAASPSLRHLVAGIETADSWGTDGHKWLNVPYDSGYAFCAHPEAHAASMSYTGAYLAAGHDMLRAPGDYVLESSRRARGFATWAALAELGRSGVADLIDRCCALARRFADGVAAFDGVEVGNDVALNQVLVSFGDDARTDAVIDAIQRSGECWMGSTTWHGRRFMRVSVSSWRTTEADIDRTLAAVAKASAARG